MGDISHGRICFIPSNAVGIAVGLVPAVLVGRPPGRQSRQRPSEDVSVPAQPQVPATVSPTPTQADEESPERPRRPEKASEESAAPAGADRRAGC